MNKKNIYKLMYLVVMALVLFFIIRLGIDAYNVCAKTGDIKQFAICILIRIVEFIIPAAICLLIGKYLEKDLKFNK